MIPRASNLQKQDQRRELLLLSARVARKLAFVFLPLYGLLMVTGYEFITVLFTEQYAASWPIFAVNLTLLPFQIFMTDPIMRAYREHRFFVLKVVALLLPILLVTLYFRARQAGLAGTIIIVVGLSIVGRLIALGKVAKILGAKWRDLVLLKDVGKITVAVLVAAALTVIVLPVPLVRA
jgi:O-antigen/teichoic acid export membrane protein